MILHFAVNHSFSTSAMESPLRSPPKLDLDSGSAESALPTSPHPTAMDMEEGNPSPRHVSKEELKILQTCLRRWRTEVEDDVRGQLSDCGHREYLKLKAFGLG